jgi:hypothetical protein
MLARVILLGGVFAIAGATSVHAACIGNSLEELRKCVDALEHRVDALQKQVDDKVRYGGPVRLTNERPSDFDTAGTWCLVMANKGSQAPVLEVGSCDDPQNKRFNWSIRNAQ